MNPYSELINKIHECTVALVAYHSTVRTETIKLQQRQLNVLILILISQWGIYFWHEAQPSTSPKTLPVPYTEPDNRSYAL